MCGFTKPCTAIIYSDAKKQIFFIHQKAEEEPRFQNKYFSNFLAVQDSQCLLASAKILFGKWDLL